MATDFGTDFVLDEQLSALTGIPLLLSDLRARLMQRPDNEIIDDIDYGYDIRDHLNAQWIESRAVTIQSRIELELRKDERVDQATCSVTYSYATRCMTVTAKITTSEGEFPLVLSVSALTVELLTK